MELYKIFALGLGLGVLCIIILIIVPEEIPSTTRIYDDISRHLNEYYPDDPRINTHHLTRGEDGLLIFRDEFLDSINWTVNRPEPDVFLDIAMNPDYWDIVPMYWSLYIGPHRHLLPCELEWED